ncbi:MAG: ABC transporter permease [Verrucomicrobiae bacterium]|nr:ABC transporter permease [Verrucomicrobiae bacterium]
MKDIHFSVHRFLAIVIKEFIQMRRDRLTFGMMIGIPILQLILFGYAINSDPKHLPTAILCADNGIFSRTLVYSMRNSDYFAVDHVVQSEKEAHRLLATGKYQFILQIPEDFTRRILRGECPGLVLLADATDPSATSNAITAIDRLAREALDRDLKGPLQHLRMERNAIDLRIHRMYNPEGITQYNIVPGLMGVILTMTMVMITSLAITRERERGTMENLLSTPAHPLEVMIGKLVPYILVGYVQVCLILVAAQFLFEVPMLGSLSLLLAAAIVFIAANLAVGITVSTVATNQLQAVQMSFFFFLPSLLLSGFMFPFRGMPTWAQAIGQILPLTHFHRLVRGILLKGNTPEEILPHLLPISVFLMTVLFIGWCRYRQTLD